MKIEKNIYQLCFDKTMQDYDIFLNMTKKKNSKIRINLLSQNK